MKLTAALMVCALCVFPVMAAETPSPALLVLNKGGSLAIVDPATNKVVGRVPTGAQPHEVTVSDDGRLAFTSNYGESDPEHEGRTISMIGLASQKELRRVELGPLHRPHGLAFAGGELYFTVEMSKLIARYDPEADRIDWYMGTGQNRTHMIFVSGDGKRVVTSNVSSATMTILDLVTAARGRGPAAPAGGGNRGTPSNGPPGAPQGGRGSGQTNWDATVIAVGRGVEGFDVSPDGKEIWAANAQDGTISVIDASARTVSQTIQANVNGANRLKFTPDGTKVLVSSLGGPELAVFDVAKHQALKRIPIGKGAAGIEVQPDGARAYVACTPDNYIAIIDLKTLEVAGRIEAGRQPDGMAWAVRR